MGSDSISKPRKLSVTYLPNSTAKYHLFFVTLCLFLVSFVTLVLISILTGGSNSSLLIEELNLNLQYLPVVKVRNDGKSVEERNPNCTYWDCFNVYHCGKKGHNRITVYVYPLLDFRDENDQSISQLSREFYDVLKAVKGSRYYTPDPEEACAFLPSIDTLNQYNFKRNDVERVYQSLSHWNDGENHIIFNMLPGSAPEFNNVIDLKTSRALIAGAGFDTWTFRYGFDISIPVYSEVASNIPESYNKYKTHLVVSTQLNIPIEFKTTLQNIASSSNELLLLENCSTISTETNRSKRCQYKTGTVYQYPEVLKDSIYCLVTRSARLAQSSLMDVLASGCIPVIVADSIVLPLENYIDWYKIGLVLPEENLVDLLDIVNSVSEERKNMMAMQTRWVFDKYFASMEKITKTVLDILNERVFPLETKSYEDWNWPDHLYGPRNPLILPMIASKQLGFTAVILTYDRVESLFKLITQLVKTPSLVKIIVIWNNQKKTPPHSSEWPVINKPLKVIQTRENKLSNRFYPYDEIETECQLTIDDDIVMLTPDELEFGFDVWREFSDRIVGFPSRLHVWDNLTSSWRYESEWTNEISMVLTGAAFHHKIWSYYYTYKMPSHIRHWVDDNFNCEDIAMNFLVANVTGKPPIKVAPRKKFKCPECAHNQMLSADAKHLAQRSLCLNKFAEAFGGIPLKTVEFRADPVQYKDNLPPELLLYKDVGAL